MCLYKILTSQTYATLLTKEQEAEKERNKILGRMLTVCLGDEQVSVSQALQCRVAPCCARPSHHLLQRAHLLFIHSKKWQVLLHHFYLFPRALSRPLSSFFLHLSSQFCLQAFSLHIVMFSYHIGEPFCKRYSDYLVSTYLIKGLCFISFIYANIHSLTMHFNRCLPVQLHVNANIKLSNHMAATQCIQASRHGQDDLLKFKLSNRIVKKGDLTL